MMIKLDDIIPNRFQPREVFDEEALNKLADSIRQHGVIEPILVRPVSNKYEIIAGERRYKASVMAGLTAIPAIVRQLDDKESSIVAFIENEHRSDVSAIEEARTMERILKNNNMTQEELAKELGVNQSTIANKIRLLNLPFEVQDALMHNEISERHARSLLSVKEEDKQIELLQKIKEKKMTVRELDSEIKSMNENMNNFNEQNNMGSMNSMPGMMNPEGARKEFDPNAYLNSLSFGPAPSVSSPMPEINTPPTPPMPSAPADDDGFMSFLNNYANNPLPEEPKPPVMPQATLNEQIPSETPESNDFRNILNNYENKPSPSLVDEPASTPAVEETNSDGGFMDFLNNYEKNNPVEEDEKMPALATPESAQAVEETKSDGGFMDFLNNYDNNNPVQDTPAAPSLVDEPASTPVAEETKSDGGFMDFLNSYDNKNPLPPEEPETPEEPVSGGVTSNYVNKPETDNLYSNFSTPTNDNVSMSNPVPTLASAPENQYVENSENYVDISKKDRITDIDTIINKLGDVVKEIKEKSVYKIDTDEINYDDIYQITIKIDKRDF